MKQEYLSVTTAEALKMAIDAPANTIFKARLRVELIAANGKPSPNEGVADLTLTRDTFRDVVGKLLDADLEADGQRIPLSVQEFGSGEFVYWIG